MKHNPLVDTPAADLDARITDAFSVGATSSTVAALIKATEAAAGAVAELADHARNAALDPVLSGAMLTDARKHSDEVAFKRDRLNAALVKLRERLTVLKDQEENDRRQVAYDRAAAERDTLATELATLYPDVAPKLADLLKRIQANDTDIEIINRILPTGASRLLGAELQARGMLGWVSNGIETPRITDHLCLPAWAPRSSYLWPPGK